MRTRLLAVLVFISLLDNPAEALSLPQREKSGNIKTDKNWFVSFYGGQVSDDKAREVLSLNADYVDSYFCAFAAGKKFANYRGYIDMEAEGQIVKHWDFQDHFEFNALFIFRWLPFPWDEYLDTSFAVGDGCSYATKDPEIEVQEEGETSNILNYLMLELAFILPGQTNLSIFLRLHHRSGIFGLIDGVHGGSNATGIGFRYNF